MQPLAAPAQLVRHRHRAEHAPHDLRAHRGQDVAREAGIHELDGHARGQRDADVVERLDVVAAEAEEVRDERAAERHEDEARRAVEAAAQVRAERDAVRGVAHAGQQRGVVHAHVVVAEPCVVVCGHQRRGGEHLGRVCGRHAASGAAVRHGRGGERTVACDDATPVERLDALGQA